MRRLLIIPLLSAGCDLMPNPSYVNTEPPGGSESVVEGANADADGGALVPSQEEAAPYQKLVGPLGRTIASLGNASEPGLWLKTPLVSVEGPGRVTYTVTGRSTAVTLIPIGGPTTAGSRLSLQAMQALGASLTDLPEIEVRAGI